MNATLICYSCAIVGNDGARKKTLLNKLPMYKILKVTRMCVSSMRMEDCGTQEADQAVTRGAKALLSSYRSLVTYHPLFCPLRFGKIRHERIAMLFRRGIRASALLERYKMGGVTSCARSSHTLERACKKKQSITMFTIHKTFSLSCNWCETRQMTECVNVKQDQCINQQGMRRSF